MESYPEKQLNVRDIPRQRNANVKKRMETRKITKTEIHGKGRPVLVPKKGVIVCMPSKSLVASSFLSDSFRSVVSSFVPENICPPPKNANHHERMLIVQKPLLTCARSLSPRPSYRAPYDSIEYSPRIQYPSFSFPVVCCSLFPCVAVGYSHFRVCMLIPSPVPAPISISFVSKNECPVYNPSMVGVVSDVCKNAEKSRILCCPTPDALLGI